ncbi:MAG: hypothetical protein RL518_633 [Pseudomonadota bacterium]|jgi:hypothetical protein
MTFRATIEEFLSTSHYVMRTYLSDMSDEDILTCPVDGAHHAAWQLGHLIMNERRTVEAIRAGAGVDLPEGFEQAHAKEVAVDSRRGTLKLSQYLELMIAQRDKTKQVLMSLSDDELERPAPEFMRGYARSVSSAFMMIGSHEMMHAGQLAVIRRRLSKAVVI